MKTAIITGAGSGYGREMALRFAREGYEICVADINEEGAKETVQLLQDRGDKAWAYTLDVRDSDNWQALKAEKDKRWSQVDVLINNAGVATADTVEGGSWDDWEWVMDINLKGVVLGCRTFISQFKKQRSGAIINIASLAGLICAPFMGSYNVTKAGVVALTDTLHYELKLHGIHVTAVCPGFFRTNLDSSLRTDLPGMRKMLDKVFASSELTADQIADMTYKAMLANKRILNPHKVGRRSYLIKRFLPPVFNFMMTKQVRKMNDRLGI